VDHPLNLYGATKQSNELMAHAYAHLFALPATGLRFFSVYGPWGRPDMAMWIFAEAIRDGAPVRLFNGGELRRDFTYIDDVTEAVVRLLEQPPTPNRTWSSDSPDAATSSAPWRIYNIGSSRPIDVREIVRLIEKEMGRSALIELLPMQPRDVIETCADSAELERTIGFRPRTLIEDGVRLFVEWFREFYRTCRE
jgi:UDP-glucuronate 4-epimerase